MSNAEVQAAVPALRLSLTAIEDEGMGKGKMQAALTAQRSVLPASCSLEKPASGAETAASAVCLISYEEERAKRVLYVDPDLHLVVSLRPLTLCRCVEKECGRCQAVIFASETSILV